MKLAGSWLSDVDPQDIAALVGFVALVYGCYLAWEPMAYVIGGGLLLVWCFAGNHAGD